MIGPDDAAHAALQYLIAWEGPEHARADAAGFEVVDGQEAVNVNVWNPPLPLAECWVVYLPQQIIAPSTVLLVAKRTCRVVYHGSANDEG